MRYPATEKLEIIRTVEASHLPIYPGSLKPVTRINDLVNPQTGRIPDVTIIGGGIFGLSCGWEIARRGAHIRVLEATRIGAGSSGGHVGALAPHAPENWNEKKAFQLESLLMAPDFWAGVETASGQDSGFSRSGRLQPLPDHETALRLEQRIAASARRWPVGTEMRVVGEACSRLQPISPCGLWLEDGLTARVSPKSALASLAAAIRSKGGEIVERMTVSPGQISGPTLWATGVSGLEALSQDLGRNIGKGMKGQSALLRYSAPDAPQVFSGGVHIVPHGDGTVAVGSTSENEFAHEGIDEQLDEIIAKARMMCPQLGGAEVIDRWSGIRPRAKSRAPLLGRWPGRKDQFVANGGFKIGFGVAPKIAEIVADLLLEGRDLIPGSFRPGQ